ncbi:MAG: hypothetical protein OEZ22_05155 [Spirochaetia bacterium]|nr:hypothetical protein [Spirochaetia bacterium]
MFSRYQASGELRITSIFVNPTTLGLIMVLLTYYILMNFIITISIKKKRRVWFILMSINSWLIIIFSGSKTAIVMMLIIYVFFFIYRLKKKSLMFIVNIIFSIFFLSLIYVGFFDFESILNPEHFGLDMKIREFKMTSLESRLIYIKDFFIGVDKNILFPWYNSYSYVDNAYLDIWGTFGLLSLLFFLFHNIVWLIKAYKKKRYFLFNMLLYLLIMGTVTNIFYLSQIAYIYWYIVALINSNKKKVKMKYDQ